MSFLIRPLQDQETVGGMLKSLRKNQHRTISELAAETKLRPALLRAFEANQFQSLPAPVYARQYIRSYAKALGADPDYVMAKFNDQCGACDLTDPLRLPREKVERRLLLAMHRLLRVGGFAALALVVIGYLAFQVQAMYAPPEMVVYEPADGTATKEALIEIRGQAEKEVQLTINGLPVLPARDGAFRSELVLERGLNLIRIEAAKRHSRPAVIYRRVVLEDQSQADQLSRGPASF